MLRHIATWASFTRIVENWSQLLLVMRGNQPVSRVLLAAYCLLGIICIFFIPHVSELGLASEFMSIPFYRFYLC